MNIVEEKLAEHLHTRAARSEVRFTVDDVMEGRHEIVVFEGAQVRRFRLPRLVVGAVLVMAVGLLATVVLSTSGRTQLDSVPANPDRTTPTSSPTTTAEGVAEPTEPTTAESPIDETNSPTRTDPAQTSVGDTSEPDTATTSGELPNKTAAVEADIALVDRLGPPAIETVVHEVPDGTTMIEISVNNRLVSRVSYVPGAMTVSRVAFNTDLDVVVIAVSASNVELGRTDVQRLGRVDRPTRPRPSLLPPP